MQRSSRFTLLLTISLIASACGSRATPPPTIDPVEVQNTIAAAALTMVAETQAAIPTFTPTETPTNTPPPTATVPPLPTLDATFTPVPTGSSGGDDPCIHQVLPPTLEGEKIRMRIDNSTQATVNLTVYLNQNAPQDECGYRSYTLEPGQFMVINDLVEGCYTLWAWNPIPEEYFIVTNGTNCLDRSENWLFNITTRSITLGFQG
jgi:hypothetical protein